MSMDTQLVELCQALIRRPSVSGEEKGVAEFLKGTMEQLGYDQVEIDRYGSVLGRIHGKRPGPTVLMDGHIDTVPVEDPGVWKHAPFAAEIEDGRIYGRGASDMKGSVASMVLAVCPEHGAGFCRHGGGVVLGP